MSVKRQCSHCEADLTATDPGDRCPRCLLELGLNEDESPGGASKDAVKSGEQIARYRADAGATSRDSKLALFDIDAVTMLEQDDNDGSGNGCDSTLETDEASALAGVGTTNSGTHFLSIEAKNGDTLPYRLFLTVSTSEDFLGGELEPNDTPPTATVIARPDAPVGVRAGALSSDNDSDLYAIYATPPSLLHISADADPERVGKGVDVVVELFDPAGNVLFTADSSRSGSLLDAPAEAFCFLLGCAASGSTDTNQPYLVRVRSAMPGAVGKYDLMVALCPIARPELRCPGDQVVSARGDGAVLTYGATAFLGWSATTNAVCNPPSGTFLKIGSHTIACAATDPCGQTSQCTFTVTVNASEIGPTLTITRNGETVVASWPASFSDYNLQTTTRPEDPSSWAGWQVGDQNTTTVPQPLGPWRFFRLRKQP